MAFSHVKVLSNQNVRFASLKLIKVVCFASRFYTLQEGIPDYGIGCRSPTAVDSEFRVSLLVTMLYDQNISSDVFNPGSVHYSTSSGYWVV